MELLRRAQADQDRGVTDHGWHRRGPRPVLSRSSASGWRAWPAFDLVRTVRHSPVPPLYPSRELVECRERSPIRDGAALRFPVAAVAWRETLRPGFPM